MQNIIFINSYLSTVIYLGSSNGYLGIFNLIVKKLEDIMTKELDSPEISAIL